MNNLVEAAWGEVKQAYQRAHINSERTMQAVLYRGLISSLSQDQIVLCEPTIAIGKDTYIPDLVVISGNVVKVVLELKFVPHRYPTLEDLGKLETYAEFKEQFPLLLNPETGRFSQNDFRFSEDCLLVFAVIGQHDSKALDEQAEQVMRMRSSYGARFIHLRQEVPPRLEA